MNARKTEDHHHTLDDVAGYLVAAKQLMAEAGLSVETHDATLAAVVTLLSSKQIFYEQVAPLMAGLGNVRQ